METVNQPPFAAMLARETWKRMYVTALPFICEDGNVWLVDFFSSPDASRLYFEFYHLEEGGKRDVFKSSYSIDMVIKCFVERDLNLHSTLLFLHSIDAYPLTF